MSKIIRKLSYILESLSLSYSTVSIFLLVLPVAIIDEAARLNQSPLAVYFVVDYVTFIDGSVLKDEDAATLGDICTCEPLSLIEGSVLGLNRSTVLSRTKGLFKFKVVIHIRTKFFTQFLHKKKVDRTSALCCGYESSKRIKTERFDESGTYLNYF